MSGVKVPSIAFPDSKPSVELKILGSTKYGIKGYNERGGQYQRIFTLYTNLQQVREVSHEDQIFLSKFIRLMNEDSMLSGHPEEQYLIDSIVAANNGNYIEKAFLKKLEEDEEKYINMLTQGSQQKKDPSKEKRFRFF
jgi:uncharacterized ubiquitin-like protein YukD